MGCKGCCRTPSFLWGSMGAVAPLDFYAAVLLDFYAVAPLVFVVVLMAYIIF